MSSKVVHVTDENFQEEVLASDIPVFVDFWAEWCAPCRMVGPFIDQLSQEYEGRLKVVKCNIDESPKSASDHSVSSIPTLMVFKNGSSTKTTTGALPLMQLKAFVDTEL